MNKNQLTVGKVFEFEKPLIDKLDSIIDICFRVCKNRYFRTFDHICVYNIDFTNYVKNEVINMKISDKSKNLYELIEKLKVARQKGFIVNQIYKLTIKAYNHLSQININYYLKLQIPMMHRQFF